MVQVNVLTRLVLLYIVAESDWFEEKSNEDRMLSVTAITEKDNFKYYVGRFERF